MVVVPFDCLADGQRSFDLQQKFDIERGLKASCFTRGGGIGIGILDTGLIQGYGKGGQEKAFVSRFAFLDCDWDALGSSDLDDWLTRGYEMGRVEYL